jgi:glycosyltransferase involved in cell wall biosynthesis
VYAAHAYVIPLRVGSGTRIKAFEALAMGCPMVSTTLGVEGLDITPGQHYLAADTAEDFATAILRLLDNPTTATTMAHTARALLEEKFSWSQVARQFEAICLETLSRRR